MSVFEFVLGVIVTIIIGITIIGCFSVKYESQRLEEENKQLKEKLSKKNKRDYNKSKKEEKKQ